MKTIKTNSVVLALICLLAISCDNKGCDKSDFFSIIKSASESVSLTEYNSINTIWYSSSYLCENGKNTYYGKTLKIKGWYIDAASPYIYDTNIAPQYESVKKVVVIMPQNDTILQKIADSAANFPCYITGKFLYDCRNSNDCDPMSAYNFRIEITNSNQITFKMNENEDN